MEALIALIAVLVQVIAEIAFTAIVEGAFLLLLYVVKGLVAVVRIARVAIEDRRTGKTTQSSSPRPPVRERIQRWRSLARERASTSRFAFLRVWSRRLAIASGILFAVTLVTLLVINQFFIGAVVRWAAADLPQRHGMTLDFQAADGNLFTGRVHLTQAAIQRTQHPSATFNLSIEDVEADVNLSILWRRKLELKQATVRGIRGEYTRVGPKPERPPKRTYTIERLRIEDAKLTWHDATRRDRPVQIEVEIDELEATPVRSDWAAFDVLFRSTGHGRIAGGAFTIATGGPEHDRRSEWHVDGLPVTLASSYLGGAFRWIDAGAVDVEVINNWQSPDVATDIRTHWNLTFRKIHAEAPDDLKTSLRIVAQPAVAYFNAHAEHIPLRLETTVSKHEFTGRMSPPLELITDAVSESAKKALSDKFDATKEKVEQQGRELLDKARNLFKRDKPEPPP